jgi:hypothetical protein
MPDAVLTVVRVPALMAGEIHAGEPGFSEGREETAP